MDLFPKRVAPLLYSLTARPLYVSSSNRANLFTNVRSCKESSQSAPSPSWDLHAPPELDKLDQHDATGKRTGSTLMDLAAINAIFKSPAQSLFYERGLFNVAENKDQWWTRPMLKLMGFYSRRNMLSNGALILYDSIKEQAEDEDFKRILALDGPPPSPFMSTFSLLSLHMWLIIVRLRDEPTYTNNKEAKKFANSLFDLFLRDVEDRVHKAGVEVRVQKWVKHLQQVFYFTNMAYDRALFPNMYGAGGNFVDLLEKYVYEGSLEKRDEAQILARYLLREMECLKITDVEAIYHGQLKFSTDLQQMGKRPGVVEKQGSGLMEETRVVS